MAVRNFFVSVLFAALAACASEQAVDSSFRPTVAAPAYREGPVVAIDEGHRNFHTAATGYAPFADLLRADGYRLRSIGVPFDEKSLQGIDVLVISNALGDPETEPAFTADEAGAIDKWIRNGGSLLLIADHAPFGGAALELAKIFNVDMGGGYVTIPEGNSKFESNIEFSGELLGSHPILSGREPHEAIHRVKSFTGQSLSVPKGGTALLKLPAAALEAANEETLLKFEAGQKVQLSPVGGRAQAVALTYGQGRVVVMGEAAMFTAQVIKEPGRPTIYFGMTVPGFDNRQLALNTMHWLSRILP